MSKPIVIEPYGGDIGQEGDIIEGFGGISPLTRIGGGTGMDYNI